MDGSQGQAFRPVPSREARFQRSHPLSNPLPPDRPLTLKQIAEYFQVCTKTVRRVINDEGIPVVKIGGQIRVPAAHLALFVKKKW